VPDLVGAVLTRVVDDASDDDGEDGVSSVGLSGLVANKFLGSSLSIPLRIRTSTSWIRPMWSLSSPHAAAIQTLGESAIRDCVGSWAKVV